MYIQTETITFRQENTQNSNTTNTTPNFYNCFRSQHTVCVCHTHKHIHTKTQKNKLLWLPHRSRAGQLPPGPRSIPLVPLILQLLSLISTPPCYFALTMGINIAKNVNLPWFFILTITVVIGSIISIVKFWWSDGELTIFGHGERDHWLDA